MTIKRKKRLREEREEALEELRRERLQKWRREPVTKRIDRPTKLETARKLGYKPKQGVIVVRQRVRTGGRKRNQMKAGRKPTTSRRQQVLDKNYQEIAEEKVQRQYDNCEVLNSYKALEDGKHAWYEVILVDRFHEEVLADDDLRDFTADKNKVFR